MKGIAQSIQESPHFTAMVLSTISGLSTGLGGLIVVFFGSPSKSTMGFMLGFASGVMLYVSFLDLLPETIEVVGMLYAHVWFVIGMIFFHILTYLVPEPDPSKIENKEIKDAKLWVTSIIVVVGLMLHNIPEGMAVYLSAMKGWKLGLTIAISIALHNLPEGTVVAVSMYAATKSKWAAIKWSFISGVCEPAGAIAFGLFLQTILSAFAVYCMLAAVAGMMTYICIRELIPHAITNMESKMKTLISNLLGMAAIFTLSTIIDQYGVH